MKIESIIRRKNGTRVEMDDQVYHFKPTPEDVRHIADVSVAAHVKRFLAIPEGFQPAEVSEQPKEPAGEQFATLAGVQNEDGSVSTLAQLPREDLLVLARDMDIANADDLSDEELIKAISAEPVEIDEQEDEADQKSEQDAGGKEEPAELSRDDLAKQYEAKFGKKPHHKLSAERIAQILAEDGDD